MSCMALHEDKVWLVGGWTPTFIKDETWILQRDETWSKGPYLKMGRFNHACGTFHQLDVEILVVAGGENDKTLNSVELHYQGAAEFVIG